PEETHWIAVQEVAGPDECRRAFDAFRIARAAREGDVVAGDVLEPHLVLQRLTDGDRGWHDERHREIGRRLWGGCGRNGAREGRDRQSLNAIHPCRRRARPAGSKLTAPIRQGEEHSDARPGLALGGWYAEG